MEFSANPLAIRDARLPQTYEVAKQAIEKCLQIDECQDWADKAAALASYARQSKDEELRTMARRIQERAIRRCGELLQEIEKATGAHLKRAAARPLSRTQAATDAGLSGHQRKTALRVANVPEREFEEAVESETPPTLTALAERGTTKSSSIVNPDAQFRRILDPVHRIIGERRSYESLISSITRDSKLDFCREIEMLIKALNRWLKELKGDL
jgi:ATP-dependent Clp protease ATP-binding subunit ClpA